VEYFSIFSAEIFSHRRSVTLEQRQISQRKKKGKKNEKGKKKKKTGAK